METDLDWRLFSDASFTTNITPVCSMPTGTADQICSTTQSWEHVLNANTTYYLKVESNTSGNIDSSYSIKVEALDPTLGCSGSAAQCFDFQNGILPAFTVTAPGNQFTEWDIDTANNATTASGGYSMKSGTISGDQTCFSYTRTGTAELLFSLKTNSVASWNYLVLYINGSTVGWGNWAGSTPWRRVWYDTSWISGVANTVYMWCYEVQSTPVAGDAVWVDDIEFR